MAGGCRSQKSRTGKEVRPCQSRSVAESAFALSAADLGQTLPVNAYSRSVRSQPMPTLVVANGLFLVAQR